MELAITILKVLFAVVAVLMTLVILMQRPKSEGLGAAFGGGVTENIFGAQTTNVLTKVTGWLAAIFFLLTFILSILYARLADTHSNLTRQVTKGQTPAPVASATPVPGVSVSPAPVTTGTGTPAPSFSAGPSATVTSSAPATTSPVPSTAISVAPATSPVTSPNASVGPSVSASPKP